MKAGKAKRKRSPASEPGFSLLEKPLLIVQQTYKAPDDMLVRHSQQGLKDCLAENDHSAFSDNPVHHVV
jgi:hypothetical protein